MERAGGKGQEEDERESNGETKRDRGRTRKRGREGKKKVEREWLRRKDGGSDGKGGRKEGRD